MEEYMDPCNIMVGRSEITIRPTNSKEIQQRGFPLTPPGGGKFAGIGEAFAMLTDGSAIVVTSARREMMVARANNAYTIDMIIKTFLTQGVCRDEIEMLMLFATTELGTALVEQARQAGLRYIWTAHPFEEPQFLMIRRKT